LVKIDIHIGVVCVARLARLIRFRSKRLIPGILAWYCLRMQTIGGGGGGSALVEVDMSVGVVSGPVGEMDRREGDFALNGRYQAYSLGIACACKRLAVEAEGVCWLRYICTLGWCVARLARLIGWRGVSP